MHAYMLCVRKHILHTVVVYAQQGE
jgi:hypothetical protein